MDILQETKDIGRKTFLSHVFSTTEDGKAEILNTTQYAIMGIIPIILLNKFIQRFIPEADSKNSTLELLAEILIQIIIMFCGIIVIHRVITYFPTYSGFKYENLTLTNVILAFLVIVLSIQTKLGIKVNILVDRALELWNGPSVNNANSQNRKNVRFSQPITQHIPSQADFLDNSDVQTSVFPPAPIATNKPNNSSGFDFMMGSPQKPIQQQQQQAQPNYGGGYGMSSGPMAANGVLGGSFGSAF